MYIIQGIKGYQVVEVLEELWLFRGAKPKKIQVDNGSEFISKEMDRWVWEQKVELVFSRSGKPK
ncbi:integrase catalytic domain-containing protein [Sphingobacterium faecium]|uniref:integrase catalytic domain-containing protein n=1 Tax=Sphingobacterium faecium TaxID=34087 RepID=UPI003D36E82A